VLEVFQQYGLTKEEATPIVESLMKRPKEWIDFMMRFELGLEEPDPRRALRSASTIAGAYIAGGMIPLAPYMLIPTARTALFSSIALTLIALFVFGFIKGRYTGMPPWPSAFRTCVIGGLAAGAAFGIAGLVSEK